MCYYSKLHPFKKACLGQGTAVKISLRHVASVLAIDSVYQYFIVSIKHCGVTRHINCPHQMKQHVA